MSLSMGRGESLGLVGPNGAGKTTTVRVSIGILRRDSGTVKLFDEDPWLSPWVRKRIGVVHDKPAIPGGMKCIDWLYRVCDIYGIDRSEAKRALELVELWDARHRRIKGLSAGMKQRLALAQALVHNPELLLLDEPFTNLDPPSRARFSELLARIRDERGVAIFITSHTLSDVLNLSSRIAIIHRGRVIFEGSPSDVERELRVSVIRIRCSSSRALAEALAGAEGVVRARVVDEQTLILEVEPSCKGRAIKAVVDASESRGIEIFDIETRAPGIEEFLKRLGGERG
ncbi:MAG: ABC transporter ATP-binding protein [Crenarchaeota archaeon]|nr:ABC transporter ATP-binding protein [Thermoproteota archaeon]